MLGVTYLWGEGLDEAIVGVTFFHITKISTISLDYCPSATSPREWWDPKYKPYIIKCAALFRAMGCHTLVYMAYVRSGVRYTIYRENRQDGGPSLSSIFRVQTTYPSILKTSTSQVWANTFPFNAQNTWGQSSLVITSGSQSHQRASHDFSNILTGSITIEHWSKATLLLDLGESY